MVPDGAVVGRACRASAASVLGPAVAMLTARAAGMVNAIGRKVRAATHPMRAGPSRDPLYPRVVITERALAVPSCPRPRSG